MLSFYLRLKLVVIVTVSYKYVNLWKKFLLHCYWKIKFQPFNEVPSSLQLISIQRYLKQLTKRGELPTTIFQGNLLQHVKLAKAHNFTEMHKRFEIIPAFSLIIDTSGTTPLSHRTRIPLYFFGKYLPHLWNFLTQNAYT